MKQLIFLLNSCDIGFAQMLLWGLIPFLLGLLLGWLLWSKFKSRIAELESELNSMRGKIGSLESENSSWSSKYSSLESELNTQKSNYASLTSERDQLQSQISAYSDYDALKSSLASLKSADESHKTKLSELEAQLAKAQAERDEAQTKAKEAQAKADETKATVETGAEDVASALTASSGQIVGGGTDKDDLKRVEGIGPKTEELLNNAGIHTWKQLANTDVNKLQSILDAAGSRFKLLVPNTWPKQAELMVSGDWKTLDEYQEYLIGGVDPADLAESSSLTAEDLAMTADVFGKKYALDDLKIVEGIGPKIEEILNDKGINTWKELARADVKSLEKILEDNGLQFHNPTTWPRQAAMAAAGMWVDLKKWQDELDAGKE